MEIEAKVMYRHATTVVRSTMRNTEPEPTEVTFAMVMPEPALVSNFSILADGEENVALVMDRKEARDAYDDPEEMGGTVGLLEEAIVPRVRNFTITVIVEADQEVTFYLTYEERLERRNGSYNYRVYLETLKEVDSLKVNVDLKESLPLKELCTSLDNKARSCKGVLPETSIDRRGGGSEAQISYEPSNTRYLEESLNILYSVVSPKHEVQIVCGHFIHTFRPDDRNYRTKHVTFVLDTGGSMVLGNRLEQLKIAMVEMLDNNLGENDFFSIIDFNTGVETLQHEGNKVFGASEENKLKAKEFVNSFNASGGTNINDALLAGIDLATESTDLVGNNTLKMIVFLTDGDPTVGERNVDEIIKNVYLRNTEKVSILSLGFGSEANFKLLQRISGLTDSLSKMIYDGSDAASQLEAFFSRTSQPTLSSVKLKYDGNVDQMSLTKHEEGLMFAGEEIVIMGRLGDADGPLDVEVKADSRDGLVTEVTALFEKYPADNRTETECALMKKTYAWLQVKVSSSIVLIIIINAIIFTIIVNIIIVIIIFNIIIVIIFRLARTCQAGDVMGLSMR